MKREKDIQIIKASGEKTVFTEQKLHGSLIRSGANEQQIYSIMNEVKKQLYNGITTKEIYRIAYSLLRGTNKHLAARYHLKRGIMELGPSGYPFERFVAEILKVQGFRVEVGVIVEGKCVKHEVDVVALQDNQHFMVECKYHNQTGIHSDVKIPLYIQARFKDIESQWKLLPGHGTKFHQGWVVTNTQFTPDAIQYGSCAGLKLLGWNYPQEHGLKDIIDLFGLYPITCLTTLTKAEKQGLLSRDVILCKDLKANKTAMHEIGINEKRMMNVMNESSQLCQQLSRVNAIE